MGAQDRRFLELHHGSWRCVVGQRVGGRIVKARRSLGTASLREAQRLRWPIVAELKASITSPSGPTDADAWKAAMAASTGEPDDPTEAVLYDHLDTIRGDPIATEADEKGNPAYIYDPERERRAVEFADRVYGRSTPIDAMVEAFLAQRDIAAKTKDVHRRAIGLLREWCKRTSTPFTLQAMTRKASIRFVDDLPSLKDASPAHLNKFAEKLSVYWRFLQRREEVDADPWQGLKLTVPRMQHDQRERAFSDEEVKRLMDGPASPAMGDLMRIAALSGARIDAIVDLKVGDCRDGCFTFKVQKMESKPRKVPISSALVGIVARRTEGRADGDDLFPEFPQPVRGDRERSHRASKLFTAYRRSVGVDETVEGKRRSLVNFHSYRRWWITRAEREGVPENPIASIVARKRPGLSLGLYSSGPSLEQLRTAIEAVRLPT